MQTAPIVTYVRVSTSTADPPDGLGCFEDALRPYTRKRNELLDALKKFASGEFQ
jgi:hypothetical protein